MPVWPPAQPRRRPPRVSEILDGRLRLSSTSPCEILSSERSALIMAEWRTASMPFDCQRSAIVFPRHGRMDAPVVSLPSVQWSRFCTSSARMKAAGPLQKLLHLANAREALALGDLPQALNEAEAAIDADATFAAAQTLRAEIVARMDAAIVSEPVVSVAAAVPVAVAMAVT